jgi:hypothetical protein
MSNSILILMMMLAGLALAGCKTTRSGYDSAPYQVVRAAGNFEIREYPALTVVDTPMAPSGNSANGGFNRLMPAKLTAAQVPKPSDGALTVRELEAGRFAVLRYSGGRNAGKESAVLNRLRSWMDGEGLKSVSEPVYGYFDPPWTPAFLRRNEVMLRITTRQESD